MPSSTMEDHSTNNELEPAKGAIYITIGPQCSGKSTILKRILNTGGESATPTSQQEEKTSSTSSNDNNDREDQPKTTASGGVGVDVTIDDQALVYISLPTHIFLNSPSIYDTPDIRERCKSLHDQMVLGKTFLSRIIDPEMDELLWVLQRLNNQIDSSFFAKRIRDDDEEEISGKDGDKSEKKDQSRTTQDDLIDAVEYVIQSKNSEGISNVLPRTVDLFICESIFQPRPLSLISRFAGQNNPLLLNNSSTKNNKNVTVTSSALEAAQTQIRCYATDSSQHPSTAPISWGNTNTRPREMISALDAAEKSNRPVQFIIYGGLEACDLIHNHIFQFDDDMKLCLPKSSRLVLLQRNIKRFVETGRYIPSLAIASAIERVDSMLALAVAEANKKKVEHHSSSCDEDSRTNDSKFRLDFELAKLAGYHLHPNRTVSSLPPHRLNHKSRNSAMRQNSNERGNYFSSGRGNSGNGNNNNEGRNSSSSGRSRGGGDRNHYYQRSLDNNNSSNSNGSRGGGYGGRGRRRYYYAQASYYNRGGGDSYQSQNRGNCHGGGSSSSNSHQGGQNSFYRGSEDPPRMGGRFERRGQSSQNEKREPH